MHTRRAQERIDASCDLSKLLRNPILEGYSFYDRRQIHKPVRKPERGNRVFGQIALKFLYGTVELKSQIFFYEVKERPDFLWFK